MKTKCSLTYKIPTLLGVMHLGKHLGLIAKKEDALVAALAASFDADNSKPMKRKRKKCKGKKRKE